MNTYYSYRPTYNVTIGPGGVTYCVYSKYYNAERSEAENVYLSNPIKPLIIILLIDIELILHNDNHDCVK